MMSKNIYWKKDVEVLVISNDCIILRQGSDIYLQNKPNIGITAKVVGEKKAYNFNDFYLNYFLKNKWIDQIEADKDNSEALVKELIFNECSYIENIFFNRGFLPNDINALYQKEGSLLVRLYGSTICLGPIFSREKSAPCPECMSFRLKWNDPIYSLQDKIQESVIYNNDRIDTIDFEWLKENLKCNNSEKLGFSENKYIKFDTKRKLISVHNIIKRPQCKLCGDSDTFYNQCARGIEIYSEEISSVDGGLRVIPPTETVKKIEPFIDNESGIITYFTPDNNIDTSNNYRCAFHKSPYNPSLVKNTALVQITVGKGINKVQSKASALGEAVERLAANYSGDEPCFFSEPENLDLRYYLPKNLAPFSDTQFKNFLKNSDNDAYQLYATYPYNREPMHWTPVWSLTKKEKVYLPSNYCFDNTPFISETFSKYYQNGCSAGNILSEAILQGILEIIERDAIAIWWYNKVERNSVDYSNFDSLVEFAEERINKGNWKKWVLDISGDFNVPVFAAIGQRVSDGCFSLGFGCHLSAEVAVKRAVTELAQMIGVMENNCAPFDFHSIKDENFLHPLGDPKSIPLVDSEIGLIESITSLIKKAESLDLEVLALNTSRADIPLKTVKIVIPGMCHMFPFFAAERLYNVPVDLGFLYNKKTEEELNNIELLI